jgi:hypothetical protein
MVLGYLDGNRCYKFPVTILSLGEKVGIDESIPTELQVQLNTHSTSVAGKVTANNMLSAVARSLACLAGSLRKYCENSSSL